MNKRLVYLLGTSLVAGSLLSSGAVNTPNSRQEKSSITKELTSGEKDKILRNYLEQRVKLSSEMAANSEERYRVGLCVLEEALNGQAEAVYYETAQKAFVIGDEGVFDHIAKEVAYRNSVFLPKSQELLREELVKRYQKAGESLKLNKLKYEQGMLPPTNVLRSQELESDIGFLCRINGVNLDDIAKE